MKQLEEEKKLTVRFRFIYNVVSKITKFLKLSDQVKKSEFIFLTFHF